MVKGYLLGLAEITEITEFLFLRDCGTKEVLSKNKYFLE